MFDFLQIPRNSCFAGATLALSIGALFAGTGNAGDLGTTDPHAASRNQISDFVGQHCVDCHNSAESEGELDLETLTFQPGDESNRLRWITVFDRVRSGEMPPDDGYFGDPQQREAFLSNIAHPLVSAIRRESRTLGRVRLRRLNRVEYENTLHDLLGISLPLKEMLPQDTYHHGFSTVAEGQQVSHHQLRKYLQAADAALEAAFSRAQHPEEEPKRRHLDSAALGRKVGQRDPWHVGDKTIAWSTAQVYHGRIPETEVTASGWYRVTLHGAHAVNTELGEGLWCTVRSGVCFARAPMMYLAGIFRANQTPKDQTFDTWIRAGHMIEARPADDTIPRVSGQKLNNYRGSRRDKRPLPKVPGLAYTGITVEAIQPGDSAEQIASRLFGNHTIDAELPRQDIEELIRTFANRVFRRPMTTAEFGPYLSRVDDDLSAGYSVQDVLRRGYRAILVSPRFLYLNETPGPLDDYEIASRLSYFLWSTMPDDRLIQSADAGELTDQGQRRRQVQRMICDPRSDALVTALADQWLNLREIDFTAPDGRLYPEFDETLKQSMIEETRQFLAKLIRDDLPVTNTIDSDFAMLNERLAKHYGIPDVHHATVKSVPIRDEHHRGGLMTQGAILKVTANGTTTSPVVRGAFVNERLLGVTIPPPPDNVPAIEPDIRGATSIREQLAKHSDDTSCAACHEKIDPPGFALESYDVIGGWRTGYRNSVKGRKPVPVDPHHEMADGQSFEDIEGFKQIVMRNPEQIARNFVHHLVTYATGAPVTFGDRESVEAVLQETKPDYGVRSLILSVVDSPMFLNK